MYRILIDNMLEFALLMYTGAGDSHFVLSGGCPHRWHSTDIFHYFQFTCLKDMANLITRLGLDASIYFLRAIRRETFCVKFGWESGQD